MHKNHQCPPATNRLAICKLETFIHAGACRGILRCSKVFHKGRFKCRVMLLRNHFWKALRVPASSDLSDLFLDTELTQIDFNYITSHLCPLVFPVAALEQIIHIRYDLFPVQSSST